MSLRHSVSVFALLGSVMLVSPFFVSADTALDTCTATHPERAKDINYFKCVGEIRIPAHIKLATDAETTIDELISIPAHRRALEAERVRAVTELLQLLSELRATTDLATARSIILRAGQDYRVGSMIVRRSRIARMGNIGIDTANASHELLTLLEQKVQTMSLSREAQTLITSLIQQNARARKKIIDTLPGLVALTPDKGDAAVLASNTGALEQSYNDIKKALEDIRAIRPEIQRLRTDILRTDRKPPKDFGFFHVDTGRDDPNDTTTKDDYKDEVAAFTTFSDLSAPPNAERNLLNDPWTDEVLEAKAYGLRSVVGVNRVIFDGPGRSLLPNYKQRIDAFAKSNAQFLTPENIKAFYLIDEPSSSASSTNYSCNEGVPYADLEAGSAYLKEVLPNIPQYLSDSHRCTDTLQIPPTVDYVSFHDYGLLDVQKDAEYMRDMAVTSSKLIHPNQKQWVVLDAAWTRVRYGQATPPIQPSDMGTVARNYWDMVCSPTYAGKIDTLYAYRWPADDTSARGTLGARDFPASIQAIYKAIYERIKAGSCATITP